MNRENIMNNVTAKDIQVKTIRTDANPHNQNRIRKSWVLACDEVSATRLKSLPQEVKFMLYGVIDTDVSDKWIELMQRHYNDSLAAGAKLVIDRDGSERLEDDYCVNSDDHLVQAGSIIAAQLPEYIESLPEAIRKQMAVVA